MKKTLGELLEEGCRLSPIRDSPFSDSVWRIGVFYNGIPHIAFADSFYSKSQCEAAIAALNNLKRNPTN